MSEMQTVDSDGVVGFDTRRLDDKRLQVLLKALDQFERRAYGNPVSKVESSNSVNIVNVVADLKRSLGGG